MVELLSPGTESEDLGETVRLVGNPPTKWQVYEQILRVPYYIVFSRYTDQLQAFRLVGGHYEQVLTKEGLPIPELGLTLALWRGKYQNIDRMWLRWLTAEGGLIPTSSEQVIAAQQQATAAQQRAERLAAQLRELGIDPDELA